MSSSDLQVERQLDHTVRLQALNRHMSQHMMRVAEMMEKMGQPIPDAPSVPSYKIRERCVRLVLEEALELAAAAGVVIYAESPSEQSFPLRLHNVNQLKLEAAWPANMVKVADGLADVSVVNTSFMLSFGITDESLLHEVDLNNLTKFGPGGHEDPNTGKWIKPPGHTPPAMASVLYCQGWNPQQLE